MKPPKFKVGEWVIWEGFERSGGAMNYRAYVIAEERGEVSGERYYAIFLPDHPQNKQMIVLEDEITKIRAGY